MGQVMQSLATHVVEEVRQVEESAAAQVVG